MQKTILTYELLLEQQDKLVLTDALKAQTASNRASALRAFLKTHHLQVTDVVGQEMREQFLQCLERHMNALHEAGKGRRQITNIRSALGALRKMVLSWDTEQAIYKDQPTPFRVELLKLIGDHPVKRVARQAGIPYDMLLGWVNGKLPRRNSERCIHRLESFFALERGALLALAGFSHEPRRYSSGTGQAPVIPYRETLYDRTSDEYWLRPSEDSPLRRQWMDFMRYKTAAVPMLERSSKAKWRIAPLPLERPTAANWFVFLDGKEVPSARAGWAKVAGLLGWMSLTEERGGLSTPVEALQTLAWLAVPDFLERYIDWRRERNGGEINQSYPEMLGWIQSLVRPEVGYLTQCPWMLNTLPTEYHGRDWEKMCAAQMKLCRQLIQSMRGEVSVSRDPFAPVADVVGLDEPMEAIADMVRRMRADRPVGGTALDNAIWARDLVLIKLLASNPLRRRNLAHLTWRADNTGNLYQKADGSWHIRFKSKYFKNARFAAGDLDYDSPVQPSVWPDIEAYLVTHRKLLMVHATDLFFLTRPRADNTVHKPWAELSDRVEVLTRRYLWRCPGAGAHAMRSIVGTALIKASPGDYLTAARVLNDRPMTVQKHYARFTSGDGSRRMGELLRKSFDNM